jgi:hypothetical protein
VKIAAAGIYQRLPESFYFQPKKHLKQQKAGCPA